MPRLPHTLVLALLLPASLALQEVPPTTAPVAPPATMPEVVPGTTQPATQPGDTTRPVRRRPPANPEITKRAPSMLKLLAPVAARVRPSVGVVVIEGRDAALATVVRDDGYLVTKASELTGTSYSVRLASGLTLSARLVGVAYAHDLAMLKVDAANLQPVAWAAPESVKIGRVVMGVGNAPEPLAMGVISVLRRPTTGGFLGVQFSIADDRPLIERLVPGAPADKAGLKPGDLIVAVNDEEYSERAPLQEFLQTQQAGTEVMVTVLRGEEKLHFRVVLAQRQSQQMSDRARMQNTLGGALSARASDFPAVLQHDTVLQPNQQGGPLVDLDGNTVGVNIARAGRVETYALPAEVVQALVPELVSGKYPATTRPAEAVNADLLRARSRIATIDTQLEALRRLPATTNPSNESEAPQAPSTQPALPSAIKTLEDEKARLEQEIQRLEDSLKPPPTPTTPPPPLNSPHAQLATRNSQLLTPNSQLLTPNSPHGPRPSHPRPRAPPQGV